MKRTVYFFFLVIIFNIGIFITKADTFAASDDISELYGLSALLMDAKTGEVLFEKNGEEPMAIASTTKILTCLIALEEGELEDEVIISANAAAQPDVQMNVAEGEKYLLSDLLKGMMLESYNDVSVAVAEHIAGSEEAFARKMNNKAKELGCTNSYFITPNGLDDEEDGKTNHSTAKDLALILSHAIQNQDFLNITQTKSWQINEIQGKRTVSAANKNRFLFDYDGMLSGKTGFTGKAGYCYAGAAKKGGRILVAVTLGSGWPPHKNYKWQDTRKLLDYGFENYHMRSLDFGGVEIPKALSVKGGINENGKKVEFFNIIIPEMDSILLHDQETYYGKVYIRDNIEAPVKKDEVVGRIEIYRNDELKNVLSLLAADDVEKESLWMNFYYILRRYFGKISEKILKLVNLQVIIN